MVDNLLPDHVGLPHVLDLVVHLVQLMTWMVRGVILRLFPFDVFVPKPLHVVHVIIVSPQSQLDLDFNFGLVLVRFWV